MKVDNLLKSLSLSSTFFHLKIVLEIPFEGCVYYIFANLFVSLKESTCETNNFLFTLLQNLF